MILLIYMGLQEVMRELWVSSLPDKAMNVRSFTFHTYVNSRETYSDHADAFSNLANATS